jgi:putative membrane protein
MAIMPAYFVSGYLAWTMSTVLLGNLGTGMQKRNRLLVPLVASFIMVMWDFCLDPIRSTIDGAWIWEDGGAYHGVPISNFVGWYLTSFLIFQVFSWYLHRSSRNERVGQTRIYWYLASAMYLGTAVEFLLDPFFQTTNLGIYWSVFLGCMCTMLPTSLLYFIFVNRADHDCL